MTSGLAGKKGDEMSMLFEISAEAGLLKVVATGEFSLPVAKCTFLEMFEAVALH